MTPSSKRCAFGLPSGRCNEPCWIEELVFAAVAEHLAARTWPSRNPSSTVPSGPAAMLRGGMDTSQYKDYVLVLLFIKYISDKYAGQPFAPIVIPTGASFSAMVALYGQD